MVATIGLALGTGLLALTARSVDLESVQEHLAALDPRALVPLLVIALVQLPLRPWRWASAFPPRSVGFRTCFEALAIGNLVNYLVPGRGGDLLRCLMVRRRSPETPASLALGTLGVEKLLDGMALVAVLGLSGLVLPLPGWLGRLTVTAAAIFVLALLGFMVLRARVAPLTSWLRARASGGPAARVAHRVADVLSQFVTGLDAIGSGRRVAWMAFQTVMIVASEAAMVWLIAHAAGVELSGPEAAIMVAVLGLGFMLPAAPGFIGTYEALGVATLALFGVASAPAAAVTLVAHGWSFAWTAIVGVVGLAMGGLSLGDLIRSRRPREF